MLALKIGGSDLHLQKGDITKIPVDAIVNAANSFLAGGGGVDGAIHRAGGPAIMQQLDPIRAQIGSCATGNAVATTAGLLPARFVFHAVGPIYRDGTRGEAEQLASCYRTCLNMAVEHNIQTISFPSISTGVYGYPIEEASQIALDTVRQWLKETSASCVSLVKLVQFSDGDHAVYRRLLAKRATSG